MKTNRNEVLFHIFKDYTEDIGDATFTLSEADSIEDFSKVIQLDPNHVDAYELRGLAYADLKDFKKALADLEKAIQLDPARTPKITPVIAKIKKELNK